MQICVPRENPHVQRSPATDNEGVLYLMPSLLASGAPKQHIRKAGPLRAESVGSGVPGFETVTYEVANLGPSKNPVTMDVLNQA